MINSDEFSVINTFLSGGELKWYSLTSIGSPFASVLRSSVRRCSSNAVGKSKLTIPLWSFFCFSIGR